MHVRACRAAITNMRGVKRFLARGRLEPPHSVPDAATAAAWLKVHLPAPGRFSCRHQGPSHHHVAKDTLTRTLLAPALLENPSMCLSKRFTPAGASAVTGGGGAGAVGGAAAEHNGAVAGLQRALRAHPGRAPVRPRHHHHLHARRYHGPRFCPQLPEGAPLLGHASLALAGSVLLVWGSACRDVASTAACMQSRSCCCL